MTKTSSFIEPDGGIELRAGQERDPARATLASELDTHSHQLTPDTASSRRSRDGKLEHLELGFSVWSDAAGPDHQILFQRDVDLATNIEDSPVRVEQLRFVSRLARVASDHLPVVATLRLRPGRRERFPAPAKGPRSS